MIERVDEHLCIHCGLCDYVCQTDVFRLTGKGVQIAYPDDCNNCMECFFVCPTEAIVLNASVPKKFDARLRWEQIKKIWSPSG